MTLLGPASVSATRRPTLCGANCADHSRSSPYLRLLPGTPPPTFFAMTHATLWCSPSRTHLQAHVRTAPQLTYPHDLPLSTIAMQAQPHHTNLPRLVSYHLYRLR